MRYQQPYGISDPNAGYINGNPAAGVQGSIPPAAAFEQPQREIVNVIQNSDFTPDDGDLQQLLKSIRRQFLNFAIDTSVSANTVLCNLAPPLEQYHAGFPLRVVIANTNTGATVINVNGLGPRAIKRTDGADLHPNDITAGMIANLADTGSVFQLQNAVGAPATTSNTFTVQIPYCADTSITANQIVAPYSPAITSITEGQFISVKVKNQSTGGVTIQVNALAALPIYRDDGQPLQSGDLLALETILLENHNTYYQIIGLCRSQVLQPPAPKLRGFIASQQGFAGTVIPTSAPGGVNISYPNIQKNNLQTSTFDGTRLVIGAGEDGIWAIYAAVHLAQIGRDCNFTSMSVEVNGQIAAIESSGTIIAGTGNNLSTTAHLQLNVGDTVTGACYQQSGITNNSVPDNSTRFSAWLISK